MRAADLSPDRRKRLAPVPGREHVKALVPPPCPRTLDAAPVMAALIAAEKAIAGTAAVARLLPHPDLITRSLERREAVLSSQIEGTRTDLTQLLEYEATGSDEGLPEDAQVTLGYVRALDHGLRAVRREGGPRHLTLDLIRQLHRVLMSDADYRHLEGPGEWRRVQNWIGARRIEDATLVPPPVSHLEVCLLDLEDFLQIDCGHPAVLALPLRMAVAHVQFEAIHPFSDGNGRVGRLLPPLMMAAEGLPPLYLAGYLKAHQREYYDSLAGVQLQGRWTDWLGFFLDGIVAAAATEQETAQSLLAIRRNWQGRTAHLRADATARRLLDVLLGAPVQTVASARAALGLSAQAANTGIAALLEVGILREATGRRWGRSFRACEVLAVLQGLADGADTRESGAAR
ncbi:Fic family protein [Lichenicoccus sp.]|uniref:Fic family protein n=1 Tax=Lichenicoccus sp. TaxID=2781899 RepID=UPI003D0C08D7